MPTWGGYAAYVESLPVGINIFVIVDIIIGIIFAKIIISCLSLTIVTQKYPNLSN